MSETNKLCDIPYLPDDRVGYSVNGLAICGGKHLYDNSVLDNCKTLTLDGSEAVWSQTAVFQPPRYSHCNWQSSKGLYLMGGNGNENSTTLITSPTTYVDGFKISPFREACAIPDTDTDSVVITGGWWLAYLSSVTRYYVDGSKEELPNFNIARNDHGCSSYLDSQGNKVGKKKMQYFNFCSLFLRF